MRCSGVLALEVKGKFHVHMIGFFPLLKDNSMFASTPIHTHHRFMSICEFPLVYWISIPTRCHSLSPLSSYDSLTAQYAPSVITNTIHHGEADAARHAVEKRLHHYDYAYYYYAPSSCQLHWGHVGARPGHHRHVHLHAHFTCL